MSCGIACVTGAIVSLFVLYKILDRLVRVPRIGRYGDRFVLVTGCGQGFGFEAVKRLEKLGCHVFAGCRRQESVEKLKQTFSDRVHPILMDVSSHDSVRKAFEYVSSQLPPNSGLWGLVNNAAIAKMIPMNIQFIEMYEEIIATNLYGSIDVTMTFLPLVKKARGRIVNVSSIGGRFSFPVYASYCVSKYGLEAFSDGLRRSLRPFGCKVLIIEPGGVNTNIVETTKVLMEFETVWKQAQSEGRLYCSEDADTVLQREKETILKQLSVTHANAGGIDEPVDAYEQALFGVFPRARYVVGVHATIFKYIQMAPEWFSDWLLSLSSPSSVSYEVRYQKGT